VNQTSTRPTAADAPQSSPPLGRGELLAIAGFWAFMALLTSANRLLEPPRPGLMPVPPGFPLAMAFSESAVWALITPLIFRLSRNFVADRRNRLVRLALLFVAGIAVSVFVDVALDLFRFRVMGFTTRNGRPFNVFASVTHLWFLHEIVVYCGIVAAGLARDYALRYRSRQAETARLESEAAQLRAQLAEARLSALRNQMDPHFLFNTLNAVSALVERDPRGVRRMIARLSELLRHSLEGAGEPEVTLREELEFADRYLEIMRIRFQGSLEVETRVADEAMDALVPNLVLQPLVENAVKHGVGKMRGGGRIEIAAWVEDGHVELCVRDNGPGMRDASPREGVGLRNTRERLAQLYGDAGSLTLRPADGGAGVEARVTLPFHTAGDLRTSAVAAPVPAGAAG
jgi:sensor histidine kinase YesM